MRFLAPSKDDIRKWDRCFNKYRGATATGPLADGGLTAAVPLQATNHVKQLWETARFDDANPESDDKIEKFQVFKLAVKGYKFETSFRGQVKWFTNCNMQLLKDDGSLCVISAETYFGSTVTSSIDEVCLLVDKVVVPEWPFVARGQDYSSDGVTI